MHANVLLRNARRSRSLSQAELGARSGVAQSAVSSIENGTRTPTMETLERLLASTGHSLIAIPTRRSDAATAAVTIGDAIRSGDDARALRTFIQLNDDLAAEHDEIRYALSMAEPAATGVKHWDAAIAALASYRLSEEGLPIPRWVEDPKRKLGRSWTLDEGRYSVPVSRSEVPRAFLDHNVLIARETLTSV